MIDEIKAALEKAVEYIVTKCANETTSGSYIIHADDVPGDIISPGLFAEHIGTITEMMMVYDSVAEADVEDGAISVIMYSSYCPNHEPPPEDETKKSDSNIRFYFEPLSKSRMMYGLKCIRKIEDLLSEARKLFDKIPSSIQTAILNTHREPATLQHCLRWGLQAAKELREDWHTVVAGVPCSGEGGN
jgi:hypothetical protein